MRVSALFASFQVANACLLSQAQRGSLGLSCFTGVVRYCSHIAITITIMLKCNPSVDSGVNGDMVLEPVGQERTVISVSPLARPN